LIFLDDWDRSYIVEHNVCWNSGGDSGIRINGPAVMRLIPSDEVVSAIALAQLPIFDYRTTMVIANSM